MENNPETNVVKAVLFYTETSAEHLEDGTWKAISKNTERQLLEGESEWREETVDAMCVDDTIEDAIKTSTQSVMSFMIENVYRSGFTSLIEYREYLRAMEKDKGNNDNKAKDI